MVKADGYGHGAVPGRAGRARGRRDRGSGSRWSRRASRCARPGSTRRSSCCPSRRPTPPPRSSPTSSRPSSTRPDGIDTLAKAVVERGHRRAAAGAPQGRHRHAPGRRVARGGGRARASGSTQRTELRARRGLHPLRGGRRARRSVHRASSSPASARCSPTSTRPGCARRSCTRRTRPGCSPFPTPASTSCGSGIAIYGIPPAPELAGSRPAAARAVAEGPGLAREDARGRRPPLLRAALPSWPRAGTDRDRADRLRRRGAAQPRRGRRRGRRAAAGAIRSPAR